MTEEKQILVKLGNVYGNYSGMSFAGNVWDKDYYCPALRTMQGGGNQPMVIVIDKIPNLSMESI